MTDGSIQQMAALARKRALTRLAMRWERLWPALWPPAGVAGTYLVLSLLNVTSLLPQAARFGALAIAAAGCGLLLWRGLRQLRPPTADEVDRRLERGSGVKHRPLAVLSDRPTDASPEAQALWREHLRRVAASAAKLRVVAPRPGLPARDPRALRGAMAVLFIAALVIAGPEAGPRLARAVMPGWPAPVPSAAAQIQAWITPPAYTGLPPRLLASTDPAVTVPTGSKLTLNVTGASATPVMLQDGAAMSFEPLDSTSFQTIATLTASGRLAVSVRTEKLADWTVSVTPDLPPAAAFTEAPGQGSANGQPSLQTRLPWRAEDDYGLASVQAELHLRDRPDAPPLMVPLPLKPSLRTARGVAAPDLTAHPWAGLPVTGRIVARDVPGQTGASPGAALTLPERPFRNPVAQAVIAIRRQLSLTLDEPARNQARSALDGIAAHPEAFEQSEQILLNLRAIASLLQRGRGPETVDEAQARMWALALALEDGELDRTSKALEAAREKLRDALNTSPEKPNGDKLNEDKPNEDKPGAEKPDDPKSAQDKPSDAQQAEIDKRTQELREAIQRQLEALNEQALKENSAPPFDPGSPQMNGRELDRKAQQPQQSAKEGRMPDAKQKMAELEKLLEELQNARPESGEAREQRNAERRERGRQQQSAVQDMVKREGGLLDHMQPVGPPGGAAKPGTSDQDARTQKALRRALGELMQRFGDLTGQVPPSLGEADLAMREAGEAMSRGQDPSAAQQRAIEALQKGGRDMGQQVARQFGTGEQGEGEGDDGQGEEPGGQGQGQGQGNKDGQGLGQPGRGEGDTPGPGRRRMARRDPLGRPAPSGVGGAESGDVHVPDEMEAARGRALQDELRRRGAERGRPQNELDYIERLLEPY